MRKLYFAIPLLLISTVSAAEPLKLKPGEKLDGNTIRVPDKDGSVYLVPANDESLLNGVRDKIAGIAPKVTSQSCPTCANGVCTTGSCSALDEVNAVRARSGLKAFILDPILCQAAEGCAAYRASNLIQGHTSNDFKFIPAGGTARAAGCAAWNPGMGWGSCCTTDNYTYAGAASAMGRDGRRYMHLFVR